MFGFKLVRKRKEDEKEAKIYSKVVTDIYDLPGDIIKELSSQFILSDMVFTAMIGEMLKRLSSFIEIYHFNKFSYPSTYLSLKEFEKDIVDTYVKMSKVQTQTKRLELEILDYQNALKTGALEFDKNQDDRLRAEAKSISADCEASMAIILTQLKSLLVAIQSVIVDEYMRCVTGVDIISDYEKRKSYNVKGERFVVTFTIGKKDLSLEKEKSTKEESSNVET